MARRTRFRSRNRSAPRSICRGRRSSSTSRRESMRIDFVTIFPRMFDPLLDEGIIARGIKQKLLDVRVWDLRDFATDKHRSTDDEAYGGGPGMVMLAEPVLRAVEKIGGGHLVMTSPKGRRFDQNIAQELLMKKHVVFLCGRYEGFDERVREILHP